MPRQGSYAHDIAEYVVSFLDKWPGAPAFEVLGTANNVGAPLFASFAKGGNDAADAIRFNLSPARTRSNFYLQEAARGVRKNPTFESNLRPSILSNQ